MANGHDSDGGGGGAGGGGGGGNGGMKKRQAPAKTASFGGGYSTDDSNVSNKEKGGKSKQKRAGKRPDSSTTFTDKMDGGKASVIWMVLVIGLLFCLMDAMYIVRLLDRGHARNAEAETQKAVTQRIMQQQQQNPNNPHQHRLDGNFIPQTKQEIQNNQQHVQLHRVGLPGRPWSQITPEEREAVKKQRQEEAKRAEEDRIKKIKMAALEALKAEHGGRIPDDLAEAALENDEAFKPRPMSYYKEASIKDDKDRILQLFTEAGLKEMDDSTYTVLPTWSDVSRLYGGEAKIIGLEQCESFRAKGNPWDHFVSTAGTFNSGTNLMAELLIHNCHMQARMDKLGFKNRGIRWQVPWGKHTPPGDEEYRLEHKSIKDKDVDANMILPAVTIRDPYYWMQSMCKHHYTASWRPTDRCPNLIPSERDKANMPHLKDKDHFPVDVRYADFHRKYKSLTGFWNDWYNEYKGVEFQRLFVRYEDLLFHPKEVTETVCKCAGGQMNKGKFQYVVDSAKKGIGAHGKIRTGYIDAIIKYGSERNRYNGFHPDDLKYAREHLDSVMMEEFGYKYHPESLEQHNEKKDEGEKDGGNEHEDEHEEEVVKEEHEEPEIPKDEEEGSPKDGTGHEEQKESPEDGRDNGGDEAEESADLGEKGEDKDGNGAEESADLGEKPADKDVIEARESADLGEKEDQNVEDGDNSKASPDGEEEDVEREDADMKEGETER